MITDTLDAAFRSLVAQLPVRQKRADGWMNILTGLGSLSDRVMNMAPLFRHGLPASVLSTLFHQDAIARKIVIKRPYDALRFGIRVSVPDEAGGMQMATAIQDWFDDLDVVGAVMRSCVWENLYGGCVLFMALDDGNTALDSQEKPVRWGNLRRLLWLRPIDRTRISRSPLPEDYDRDETSPTFGEPLIYLLDVRHEGITLRIHRDRLIVFPGALTTDEERRNRNGWGISVLDPVYDVLQRNAVAWQSAAGAVGNAQYVVYKLKGLAHMFAAAGGEERARARARAMELAKSMINAVLVDADDEYLRENPNFGNLPDMLDKFLLDVAAAADMPVTVLWGRSPAGLNATGESDLEIWHQSLEAWREHHIRPRAQRLVEALMLSREGPTRGRMVEGWRVTFPPLRQMSDVERADIRAKVSQADASDIAAGILLPQEVALSRYRPEGYSQDTTIDLELRKRLLQVAADTAEEQADNALLLAEEGPMLAADAGGGPEGAEDDDGPSRGSEGPP